MLKSLTDSEKDDIAKWMSKKYGIEADSGYKKISTVIKWIKEAFKQYDDMSFKQKQEFKKLGLKLASDTATSNTAKSATKKVVENVVDKNVNKNTASNGSLLDSLLAKFKKAEYREDVAT